MNIVMNTSEVLTLLKEHKENHVKEYALQVQGWKEAMERWQKAVAEWTKSTSENAHESSDSQQPKQPNKPMNFTNDYDKYIELVEHHVESTIEIEEHEFNQIVKDEFHWRHTFTANSVLYSNHA